MSLQGIERIGIVGPGLTGAGLAALFCGNGYDVVLLGVDKADGQNGLDKAAAYFDDLIAAKLVSDEQARRCLSRITVADTYSSLNGCKIVFEAVFEQLQLKQQVCAQIESGVPDCEIIASATSALDPNLICRLLKDKGKLVVAHPWNPPHLVPCVEVCPSEFTPKVSVDAIVSLLEDCGRAPVRMTRYVPGFIGNRLQHAMFREALHMVEEGVVTPEDIDKTLMTCFMPRYTSIGLFEHFDFVGMNTVYNVQQTLYSSLCNDAGAQKAVVAARERGELGQKTGKGLCDWENVDMADFRKRTCDPYMKFFNMRLE